MLKILIVTQDDPFYVPFFFKELFELGIPDNFMIQGVIIQTPLGKKNKLQLFRQMLDFYGINGFLIKGIKYVIYKILNLFAVRIFNGSFPGKFSTEHVVRKYKFPIINIKDINSENAIEYLKQLNPDIIFSVAASQIFKKGILSLPYKGCFNIHTSKLPKNRGMMPNFWSLYQYDVEPISAITIHAMNEKLDDGDILVQHYFRLNPKESLDKLIKRTKKMSACVFLRAIELLNNEENKFLENDATMATYNTFPTKSDVKKFREKGLKL